MLFGEIKYLFGAAHVRQDHPISFIYFRICNLGDFSTTNSAIFVHISQNTPLLQCFSYRRFCCISCKSMVFLQYGSCQKLTPTWPFLFITLKHTTFVMLWQQKVPSPGGVGGVPPMEPIPALYYQFGHLCSCHICNVLATEGFVACLARVWFFFSMGPVKN